MIPTTPEDPVKLDPLRKKISPVLDDDEPEETSILPLAPDDDPNFIDPPEPLNKDKRPPSSPETPNPVPMDSDPPSEPEPELILNLPPASFPRTSLPDITLILPG
jgi:hypothetical protein